jgi:xanthine/uracil permease
MKIKETDFLWSCYLRYYKGEIEVPPPSNLCKYFWTAMIGMAAKVYADSNMFLSMTAFAVMFVAILGMATIADLLVQVNKTAAYFIATPVVLGGMFAFFSLMLLPVVRFCLWLETKFNSKDLERKFALTLLSGFGLFVLYGLIFHHRPWDEAWAEFLKDLPVLIGVVVGVPVLAGLGYCIYHPLKTTEVFKTFWAYLKAKKQKVCPLVEPPESWKCHENGTN